MRAHVEEDFVSQNINIYVIDDGPSERRQLFPDGWQHVPDGVRTEPSFVLPRQALDAIVKAATGVLPASDATTEHLRDAINVRDRMLAMVEGYAQTGTDAITLKA